jgi:hypothetical protein
MTWVATAIIGSAVIGGALSSSAQKKAAKTAAGAQTQATEQATQAQLEATRLGIEEQRRQFDAMQTLFRPYVEAGGGALARQLDLTGVSGPEAQQRAIQAIEMGPEFAAMTRQGEEAILQNAAATGGLRGGNVQASLAKFRPEVLSSLINQQYQRLGGLTQLGQASAGMQAASGQAFANNASNLFMQRGDAQARKPKVREHHAVVHDRGQQEGQHQAGVVVVVERTEQHAQHEYAHQQPLPRRQDVDALAVEGDRQRLRLPPLHPQHLHRRPWWRRRPPA